MGHRRVRYNIVDGAVDGQRIAVWIVVVVEFVVGEEGEDIWIEGLGPDGCG